MTLCVLGMSQEFKNDGIAVNGLWPKIRESVELNVNKFFPLVHLHCTITPLTTNVLYIPAQTFM